MSFSGGISGRLLTMLDFWTANQVNIYVLTRLDAGSQAGVRGLASVPSVHTSPGKAQDSGDATTTPWAQLSRHTSLV